MFVRKLRHPNGRTYVQVIEKRGKKYVVLRSFGAAKDSGELKTLLSKAENWIEQEKGQLALDFSESHKSFQQFADNIVALRLVGAERVVGKVFDDIGFGQIGGPLFRSLVLYRLVFPSSKLKMTEYLLRYEQKEVGEDAVYRYMDRLHSKHKDKVQRISYEHTVRMLGEEVSVVFYDVTTLYFEIDKEDGLRKTGFSKEGKHHKPQIVLGLLVSRNGYPLAYDVFEGNKFEGHTMLPVIDSFKEKYKLGKLTVIADSGLLSKSNVEALVEREEEFILGARIKGEKQAVKEQVLALDLKNGESAVIEKGDGLRLVVNYSDSRAKKDRFNRERGLKRLEQKVEGGRLTKKSINNRGYNKYLKLDGEVKIKIDYVKYKADAKWDGLKGYLTNSSLDTEELLTSYRQLWEIEYAFRVAKSQLKIRPVYHRLQRRIEAHICLSFTAYKVYKELERQLRELKSEFSAQKAIEVAMSIFEIEVALPNSTESIKKTLLLTEEHRAIADLFGFGC